MKPRTHTHRRPKLDAQQVAEEKRRKAREAKRAKIVELMRKGGKRARREQEIVRG